MSDSRVDSYREILAHLSDKLVEITAESECKCGSWDSEYGCPLCDKWTAAFAEAERELAEELSAGPVDECRTLLMRAVAYLPVPATIMRDGTPAGVRVPDFHQQPAVEKLRREIHSYLKRSNATPQATEDK